MNTGLEFWIGFNAVVLVVLALDLFVFHRDTRPVTFREAAAWSVVWVCLSLAFNAFVWHWRGPDKALEFFTGYLIEYSLSVDNIFVFVLIFSWFKVRPEHQHRVLLWGILGALAMRGAMIAIGVKLVTTFAWTLYVFGAFLVITGVRMFFEKHDEPQSEHVVVKWCRRFLPVTAEFHGAQFLVRVNGAWALTPLALVLIVVDVMDLVFAVDSIPAIFAVTTDSFIVYTSNICAILGLRSLYFLLAGLADRFTYLQYGLAAVLTFIGLKMLIAHFVHIPMLLSLAIVALCLAVSIGASMVGAKKHTG
ncbi:MAG: tellurite resistance protein TerC [Chthoniobacter sp.]|jgi:tellurite resistance protein TerC|nr:tellurite resistance protein TerC [Chthoniobacter sp.]